MKYSTFLERLALHYLRSKVARPGCNDGRAWTALSRPGLDVELFHIVRLSVDDLGQLGQLLARFHQLLLLALDRRLVTLQFLLLRLGHLACVQTTQYNRPYLR